MSLGYADRLKPKRDLGGQLGAAEYFESVEDVTAKVDQLAEWVGERMCVRVCACVSVCWCARRQHLPHVWPCACMHDALPRGMGCQSACTGL